MKRLIKITIILFVFLFLSINVFPQTPTQMRERFDPEINASSSKLRADSLNCELVGGWFGGSCYTIFVDPQKDTIAYIGDNDYFRILNVSDPSSPISAGELRCPEKVEDIYVVDTLAYVADADSGLRIIDVSDPTNPDEIGYYDTEGNAHAVYVVDTHAYVADSDSGLLVIDVSEPTSPVEIGCYAMKCWIHGLHVIDTVAYVTVPVDGLYIINISDPTSPYGMGFYYTGSHTLGVYVFDTLAYLAYGGVFIIDISDPANLDFVGSCGLGMEDNAIDVQVIDSIVYATDDGNDLHIVNVSDPTDPIEIGYYYDIVSSIYDLKDIQVIGDLVYIAGGEEGFYIIRHTETSKVKEDVFEKEGVSLLNVNSGIDIWFALTAREKVKVEIFNLLGQSIEKLMDGVSPIGTYNLNWNGNNGIYFIRVEIGDKVYRKKAVILR